MSHSLILHVNDLNHYFQLIANESRLILIDFSASWCGPCKKLLPLLEDLSQRRQTQLLILKVDADHDKEQHEDLQLMPLFDISSLPTLVFVRNQQMLIQNDKSGNNVLKIVGYNPDQLQMYVNQLINYKGMLID